jgi:hypothetical protein
MKSHRLASLVFVGLLLANFSCAQPKDVEQLQPTTPQLIWKYDTGG